MKTVNLRELAEIIHATKATHLQLDDVSVLEEVLHTALANVTNIDTGGDTRPVKVWPAQTAVPADGTLGAQVGGDHYKGDKIQHVEFVHANQVPYEEACAMKYLMRHRKKNKVQDVDKAIHYCFLLRKLEYPDAPPIVKVW
jgi:hypothetical protein